MNHLPPIHRLFPLVLMLGAGLLVICSPRGVTASARLTTSEAMPKRLADGFDYPVGGGEAVGYYMARKMTPYDHMGDDWNGVGGGNSDLGDPIHAIGDGVVVYSHNYGSNWGEVIIIRHRYRGSRGEILSIDSLYGHVEKRRVYVGDQVRRGQYIAQIGNNRGMYLAHLHLEIRKNIDIGIQAWKFSRGLSNYHRPSEFIAQNRPGSSRSGVVAERSRPDAGSGFERVASNFRLPFQGGSEEKITVGREVERKVPVWARLEPVEVSVERRERIRTSRPGSGSGGLGLSFAAVKAPAAASRGMSRGSLGGKF